MDNDTGGLNARELATFRGLSQIDPHLAALYERGHAFARADAAPGVVYLFAHAGRELSRGVIGALSGVVDPLSRDEEPEEPTERNRVRIAAALELPPEHGAVSLWFRAVSTLGRSVHYRRPAPALESVRIAYLQLSDLLYGRLAPYFEASKVLDALLALEHPTPEDADTATKLVARPQLRRQFFGALVNSEWIPLLAARGHFDSHPDRLIDPDGSWRMRAWPEGEYLARAAAAAPAMATEQLLRVPVSNTNPIVWGALLDAALSVNEPYASQLAARVIFALRTVPPMFVAHKAVDLVAHLAVLRVSGATMLFQSLLWVASQASRDKQLSHQEEHGYPFVMSGRSTEWVLARLDLYELQRLVERALPSLLLFDPARTLSSLVRALNGCLHLLRDRDAKSGDWVHSHIWCPDLDTADDRDDVRAILLGATVRSALALAERGAGAAHAAMRTISGVKGVLGTRLRWHIVGRVGHLVSDAVEELVGGDTLLESPFGLREAGIVLRAHFNSASTSARARFAVALSAGPSDQFLRRMLDFEHESTGLVDESEPPRPRDSESNMRPTDTVKADWQRQRLRLFHAELPAELAPLATALGHVPSAPTREQQSRDEGVWARTSISSFGGPPSPKAPEELSAMSVPEILHFLNSWQQGVAREDIRDRHWALQQALGLFGARDPAGALGVVAAGAHDVLQLTHATAILDGIRDALKERGVVDWAVLMHAATVLIDRASLPIKDVEEQNLDAKRLLLQAVVGMLAMACGNDMLSQEESNNLRRVVNSISASSFITIDLLPENDDWHVVVSSASNRLGGDVVRLIVAAGLWDYRRLRGGDGKGGGAWTGPEPRVAAWVAPVLTRLLEASVRSDDAISISIGQSFEALQLLAPSWTATHEEKLLSSTDSEINPVARAMIEGRTRSRSSLECSRSYLLQLAQVSSADPQRDGDNESSVGSVVLWRVVLGFLWGAWKEGEPDRLLEKAYAASTPSERAHVYWRIYRALSDEPRPDASFVEHTVRLWRWRLASLVTVGDLRENNGEGEGLLWLLKAPHLDPTTTIELGWLRFDLDPFQTDSRPELGNVCLY